MQKRKRAVAGLQLNFSSSVNFLILTIVAMGATYYLLSEIQEVKAEIRHMSMENRMGEWSNYNN